jgi:renalase
MHIAVVGAGLSGLACAGRLQALGHIVTVYEKSRGVSGRMSTRSSELGGFDHGAQYFTTTTSAFRKQANAWLKAGWIEEWEGRLVTLSHGKTKPSARAAANQPLRRHRFVAVPGMNALGKRLAESMDVRTEQRITGIFRHDDRWLLAVECDTVPIRATAGPFDAVVFAVPADQAVPLLEVVPDLAAQASSALLAPCWTIMLAFEQPLDLSFDGAWVQESRLGWIARDSSKPQRRPGEHWVAHATQAWSIEHLEDEPDRVKEKLLRAFHEATGSGVQPVKVMTHGWRYAQATNPLPKDCLWEGAQRLGACGDWFSAGLDGAGRIENAWLSGLAMAECVA